MSQLPKAYRYQFCKPDHSTSISASPFINLRKLSTNFFFIFHPIPSTIPEISLYPLSPATQADTPASIRDLIDQSLLCPASSFYLLPFQRNLSSPRAHLASSE